MKSKTAVIDNRAFYRKLVTIAFPIALQSLMLAAVAACDALMLGRIAQEEMTAVSLATQVQFVQNMIMSAFLGAGGILGAQYFGKGDDKTLKELFSMMLRFCEVVCLVFFLFCELKPDWLMRIFTSEEPLINIGCSYLRIAGWSYLMTGISLSCQTMMRVTDHVAVTAWISSGAVVLNVILNAVLIFGLLSFPAMNARGAALATTISRLVELMVCVGLGVKGLYSSPDWSRLLRSRKELSQDFAKQWIPLMGGGLLWGVGFTSYTAIIGHMGGDAAAANSVAAVVRDLICCVCNGIGSAAAIMVGNELGAGNLEKGKAYGIKLKNISFVVGIGSMLFVMALTPLVTRMVVLSKDADRYLTGMMLIMSFYMIGRCVNTITINGVIDAGGDTLFDMYSLAVSMWGIAIPLALLGAFVFHWPVLAVYSCTCLDEVGKIPWVMLHFRKYKWVRDLTR